MPTIPVQNKTASHNRNDQPVTSLLEKYSNMDRQFEQIREETKMVELEIQNGKIRIGALLEERQEMKALQERTLIEHVELTDNLESALPGLHQVEEEAADALSKKEQAQVLLDGANLRSKEYRQQFLQASKVFRSQCKRFKLQKEVTGQSYNPMAAYAVVKQPHLIEVFHEPEVKDKKDEKEYTKDLETLQALKESHDRARQEREDSQSRTDEIVARANRQKTEQANLQSQLDRLQEDSQRIKQQIQDLKNDKRKPKSTPLVPQRSRVNAITPLSNPKSIQNPYARKRTSSSVESSSRKQLRKKHVPKKKAHAASSRQTTTTSKQFPHRVGQVRTSRDFGLSLGIGQSDEDDDDDDDELLSYVAFRS